MGINYRMFSATTLAKSMLRQSSIFTPKMQVGAMGAFPKRFFDLHEYHSKKILGEFNVNVQKGELAFTAEQAQEIAGRLSNAGGLVVKAQVQAGGRGKGHLTSGMKGGVHILQKPEQVFEKTKGMIGYNLITHQTTAAGLPVNSVLVHEGVDIEKEFYFAFLHDRPNQGLCCVFSKKGGMDIEKVAEEDPEAIHTKQICIEKGMSADEAFDVCDKLGIEGPMRDQGCQQLLNLYDVFIKIDASQIEINPWAVTPDQDLYCSTRRSELTILLNTARKKSQTSIKLEVVMPTPLTPTSSRLLRLDSTTLPLMATLDAWSMEPDWPCLLWTLLA